MKIRTAVGLLALVTAGCGGDDDRRGPRANEPAGREAVSDRLTDDQIASLITLINGTEAASAKAVEAKLVLPAARAYARMLIEDHTRLMEAMPAFPDPAIPPPQAHGLNAVFRSQAAMMSTLPAGTPFDATVAAIQIADHAMAIDSLRHWHGMTADPRLRSAIVSALPVMEAHLQRAKELYASLDRGAAPGVPVRPDTLAEPRGRPPRPDTMPPPEDPGPDTLPPSGSARQ